MTIFEYCFRLLAYPYYHFDKWTTYRATRLQLSLFQFANSFYFYKNQTLNDNQKE